MRSGNAILDVIIRIVVIAIIAAVVVWILGMINAPGIIATIVWVLAGIAIIMTLLPLAQGGLGGEGRRGPRV